jgi:O-antigen/teichoic acid export membrane protein
VKKLQTASVLMVAATTVANGSMVIFHRAMSSNLGNHYGRLISLIAISNVLAAVTGGVNTFLVKEFSRDIELKGAAAVKGRLLSLLKPLGWAVLLLGAGLLSLGPWVMDYLHLPSFSEYALIVALFLGGLLLLVSRAAVQGIHHFKSFGLSVAIEGIGRALGGTFLVGSFGVSGGILGALSGQGLGLAAAGLGLSGLGPAVAPPPHAVERSTLGVRLREILGDTLALGLFSVLVYLDLFVTKHYYPDAGASDYGRAGLVAKSFLYLATALNMVLLPAVASAREGGRDPKKLLFRFLGAMLVVNLLGLAFVWTFTDFCLRLLCGPDPAFQALSPLVRVFSIATIAQSLFQMVLFYLLAMRDKAAVWIMGVAVPIYYTLLVFHHEQPGDVVASMGFVAAAALLVGLWAAWRFDTRVSPMERMAS